MKPRRALFAIAQGITLVLLLMTFGVQAQDDVAPPAETPTTQPAKKAKKAKKGKKGKKGKKAKAQGRKPLSKEMRALVKRYRKLPADERKALLKRFKEELKNRTPEERKRLRALARKLKQDKKAQGRKKQLQKQRERLKKMDPERRKRYTKLVRTMIRALPKEERSAFAQLEPAKRQARLRGMIKEHRKGVVVKRLRQLPDEVRKQMRGSLEGLEGKERFRQTRKLVETYVRGRAEEILGNGSLTPEQRQQRMRKLMRRHVPEGKRREQLLKRLKKQRNARAQGRPGRPQGHRKDGREGEPRGKRGARKQPERASPAERKGRGHQPPRKRTRDR
jgi:hypothetical protein